MGSPAIGPDGFPIAPGQTGVASADPNADTTDPDAVDGADTDSSVLEVASAQPVSREEMVGAWRVSTQGADCQMFMALTRWSTGFRAASRGCPGDAANVSSWNINGNRVVLSDSGGNQVATLFSSGSGRFDGQTSGGQAISLAR
ncbi:MAG: protease inhibitor Inh/omp19 family protein [Roseitalea porphyridii]